MSNNKFCFLLCMLFLVLTISFVSAITTIDDNQITTRELNITGNTDITGDLHMGGAITHGSPVVLRDGLELACDDGDKHFHIEIEGEHPDEHTPAEMDGAIIFKLFGSHNENNMEIVFWDDDCSRPMFIFSEEGVNRASTFDRSLQVGKSFGNASIDENYTLCQGFNSIDCDTSSTGADLGVEDDIEAKGSIYSQENINATGNFSLGQKIVFTLGEIIDNIVDGWITITGGLNVTENLNVVGNATIEGNLNVTGNVTADYFLGNGSYLTSLTESQISNLVHTVNGTNINVLDVNASSATIHGDFIAGSNLIYALNNKIGFKTDSPSANHDFDFNGDVRIQGDLTIVGNYTSFSVQNLLINGSLLPEQDAMFDIGNSTRRFRNGSFSGHVNVDKDVLVDGKSVCLEDGTNCVLGTSIANAEIEEDAINTSQIIDGTITDADISDITNLTLGEKITFTLGEIIDNIVDGWITITGGLNVTGNLSVDGNTLFVDSNNNRVGIGTASPGVNLDIETGPKTGSVTSNESNVGLRIGGTPTNTTVRPGLSFYSSSQDYSLAAIEPSVVHGWDTHLDFYTRQGGTLTNALHLDESGKVGIGTSSPGQDLEINGSSPQLRIRDSGATASATTAFVEFGGTDGGAWNRTGFIGDAASGNADIYLQAEVGDLHLGDSSGATVLNLQGGNVGIGTISPTQKLDVNGSLIVGGDLNVTNNLTVQSLYVGDDSIYVGNVKLDDAKYSISTGIIYGGMISINGGDNAKLDVTAGEAIITNFSNLTTPDIHRVTWDAQTIYPNLEGVRSKWIGIRRLDNGSAEFVFATSFTALERRTIAILGRAWGTGTDVITGKGQYSTPAFGLAKTVEDLINVLGSLNQDGNIFESNGANLLLDKTSGYSFRFSASFATTPQSPNIHDDSEQIGITSYKYHLQGSTTTTTETEIDPDNYDVNGVKTSVSNNNFTVQRIYYFPVSGTVHITYGQTEYGTLGEASDSAQSENVILNEDILSGSILRGWLIIKEGSTDLSDSGDANFLNAPNIGGTGGSVSGTSFHSKLSQLEFGVSGHLFNSGGVLDIGDYDFIVNETTFYINSSTGRVGIGTSSPGSKLEVRGASSTDLIVADSNSGNSGIQVRSAGISKGYFWYNSASDYLAVGPGSSTNSIIFKNGNVGIGKTLPITKFQVGDNSNQDIYMNFQTSNAHDRGILYYLTDGTTIRGYMKWDSNEDLNIKGDEIIFDTNTKDDAMRIDSTGKVGIGTTSPRNKLSVTTTSASNPPALGSATGVAFSSLAGNAYGLVMGQASSGNVWMQAQRVDGTATGYHLLLQPTYGNVGIGTNSPTYPLDVESNLNTIASFVSTNSRASIVVSDDDTNAYFGAEDSKIFLSNTGSGLVSGQLVIDSTGNVGIGTTSPTQKLDVNGSVNITGQLWINGINNTAPDYVFEEGYNLMSLTNLQEFINENKKLPDSEIQGNFFNASVTKKQYYLLEKVEEIILHIFRIDDKVEVLEEESEIMKEENRLMREDLCYLGVKRWC